MVLRKMKLIILLAVITVTKSDVLNRKLLPPYTRATKGPNFHRTTSHLSNRHSQNVNAYFGTPINVVDTSFDRPQAVNDRNAAILRHDQSNDGYTYSYVYKTSNGIYGEEKGVATNGVRARGGYSYIGDDGRMYSVSYTADENGFVAHGDHLPTPPPIPKEILRALEQNARDEAAGIFDDGSYDPAKYSGHSSRQNYKTNARSHNYNSHSSTVQKMYLPPRKRTYNQRNPYKRLNHSHRYMF